LQEGKRFRGDFGRPVSAANNSVPGSGVLSATSERNRGRITGYALRYFGILDQPLTLFRIKSERVEPPASFGRRIAEMLDADPAGQAIFHGSFDEFGGD
jgi:hypothetical protein